MAIAPTGHALAPAAGEARWFFGTLLTSKAAAAQTGDRFALVEQAGPRGVDTPPHAPPGDDESFHMLEGGLNFPLADTPPFRAAAGAFVRIPAGVPHAFKIAPATARHLDLTTPRHEAFTRAVGAPARGSSASRSSARPGRRALRAGARPAAGTGS